MLANVKTERTSVVPSFTLFEARYSAEILLRDGTRRYFRTKAQTKHDALKEVLVFVKSIEAAEGEKVYWRLKGEKIFNFGSQMPTRYSKLKKIKTALLEFFFDEEDCR